MLAIATEDIVSIPRASAVLVGLPEAEGCSEATEERRMNSLCALLQTQLSSRPTLEVLRERARQRAFILPRRDER